MVVNEHHETAYGMMPSPIVIASILARETRQCRIAILESAIPLRDHPLTLAEEHAMIDTISGRRLITGLVRGIGAEYHAVGTNPARSHERIHEAHDLILRARPVRLLGQALQFRLCEPLADPVPKAPSDDLESLRGQHRNYRVGVHGDRRYTYLQTFSPVALVERFLDAYREAAERHGYTAGPEHLGWAVPVYVGETDASAVAEATPHYEPFRTYFLGMPMEMLVPPGYVTLRSIERALAKKETSHIEMTIERAIDLGLITCGSASTVRDRLVAYERRIDFGNLLAMLQFGTMPNTLTVPNQQRFATEVRTKLRTPPSDAPAPPQAEVA